MIDKAQEKKHLLREDALGTAKGGIPYSPLE